VKRTTLRTRLLAAFLLVSIGVLAAAGITAYVLARRAAESTALSDLQDRAPEIAQSLTNVATGAAPRLNDRVLSRLLVGAIRISTGSIVRVTPDGQVVTGVDALTPRQAAASNAVSSSSELLDLPPGITAADIDPQTLLTGEQTSGTHDNMVFVAQPIGTSDQALVNRGRLVLVLTAEVDRRPFGRAGAYLVVAGGVALALAIGASYLLARRLTRPLAAMQATASQMASGDLSARVRLADSSPEELARLGDTLNSMAAQMEHARGLERAFLLSVSHDLRTPLT
jgi:nitrogen fixation/metabolism regulation signal transduction histidine kinase